MSVEGFTPSQQFQDAASFVSTAPELRNVSSSIKLELYALYKMVTVSRKPNTSRPSIFDMTGRAKWDAWARISKELDNLDVEQVQNQYLNRCKELGWNPSEAKNPESNATPVPTTQEVDVHDIDWDTEHDPKNDGNSHRGGSGGRGMGIKVSVLAEQDQEETDATTIHGLAILGEAEKLDTLHQLDPQMDINQKDEFGYTALHLAADRGNTQVVKLLLRKGADRSMKDADGFSALELAEASGKEDIVALLKTS